MLPTYAGFTAQFALFDVVTSAALQDVNTILKANANYQSAIAGESSGSIAGQGNADNVAVACILQVVAASADGIWYVERTQLTPSATVGLELRPGAPPVFFPQARHVRFIAQSGAGATVRIAYYLAGS